MFVFYDAEHYECFFPSELLLYVFVQSLIELKKSFTDILKPFSGLLSHVHLLALCVTLYFNFLSQYINVLLFVDVLVYCGLGWLFFSFSHIVILLYFSYLCDCCF